MTVSDRRERQTKRISPDDLSELEADQRDRPDIEYQVVPDLVTGEGGAELPHWRVRLEIEGPPNEVLGFELYGPLVLGHGQPSEESFINLTSYDASERGVSRRHVELRPSPHGLFVVDLNSTNGTYVNGFQLQPNNPSLVGNRDILSLALLQIKVFIEDSPRQTAEWFARQATLGQVLTDMARAITTQLRVDTVLDTVVDYALGLTGGEQASLWLLEDDARELTLKAARNLGENLAPGITRPVSGSILGEVVLTGEPRLLGDSSHDLLAITDGYGVRHAILLPITQGGVTFGVLVTGSQTPGLEFSERDQSLLTALADFAAIALHNSRSMQASDDALRQTLAAQQEATARALESARLQAEFLSTVSHELRSPLHTMLGYTVMALDGDLGEMAEGVHDGIKQVLNNGNRLNAILDDLLESLSQTGQEVELEESNFSPRELVSEVIASQMPNANKKGLTLRWSSDPDVPESVFGDAKRIYQVVLNLVSNGLKYTDSGHVTVQLSLAGDDVWAIEVADTGRGVPPKYSDVVFRPFVRIGEEGGKISGSPREGVGLGLAISYNLVRQMGGDLRLESEGEPGKGSTFTMTLPLVLPADRPETMEVDLRTTTHKIFQARYGSGDDSDD